MVGRAKARFAYTSLGEPDTRRIVADAVAERGVAELEAIDAARRISVRRILAAAWRGFVQANTYETEEGVEIVVCWCCPWFCFPISNRPGSDRRGFRRSGSAV
jgi:hypothetical protein